MKKIRISAITALAGLLLPAVASGAEPDPADAGDPDKIICRKTAEVGSLVRKKKECYTKAEWDRIAEAHQRGVKKTQEGLSGGFNCQATGTC